ncbi:hypothetical protein [Actinoallomurus liliacearum]|uniref:hypothetical protein n=1 Tax=Actinoallomurus liliacearum TaxID=1080073 RepID=UPI0031EEA97D
MGTSAKDDHEAHSRRQRGGVLFEQMGIDLYPHPHLGFTLPPGHRSAVINTDGEGFRISDSPFGPVGSESWLEAGGGDLLLGSSVAFGMAAGSDDATPASQLAALTGRRWLNLAVIAANSLQELIAAIPYLHAASTVVLFSGFGNYMAVMRTRKSPGSVFGPILYEGTYAKLTQVPLFDLAELASGRMPEDFEAATSGPPEEETDLSTIGARVETAASAQLRDLTFLARAADPRTRIVFCLQPWASPRTRDLTPEELTHYDFQKSSWGVPNEVLEEHLDPFAAMLAAGCEQLGVEFFEMKADEFVGTCFLTNGILTDEGNRQAAQIIHRYLSETPAVRRRTTVG